jgi:hypothetical protein
MQDRMDANTKAMQDRMDVNTKAVQDKMDANTKAMQDRMDVNTKVMQDRMDANTKAVQDRMDANTKAMQEKMDADRGEWIQEIRAGQEHLKKYLKAQMVLLVSGMEDNSEKFEVLQGTLVAQMGRYQEKMVDAIHSIRSELDETTQHRIGNVMTCVDHKKQGLRKELTAKLQAMKTTVDTRTENFRETLETVVTDLAVVDLGAKATREEAQAQQRNVEEETEANTLEFRSQLEEVKAVAERRSGPATTFNTNASSM